MLDYYQRKFRYVLVDEYQDTNEIQNAIFQAVSKNGQNIFTVGDVKQSIYRFRLADPTIFLFFGGFALAGALHEQKIDTWLAGKILRMARGSLGMALILIFLATAFLSMWMSNTATAAMMLPLVIGLLDRIPAEKLKTTAPFAVLGVAYSASIGGMGTLVGSPPNAIAAHELGMGFAEWFRIAMPIVLVFGVIVFCLMYLFFRPRLGLHVDICLLYTSDAADE